MLCGALALAVSFVAAQENKEPTPSDLTERVRVQLVQLPIQATDRHGNPIVDLKPEEVLVKDRGRTVRVAYLEPLRRDPNERAPLPDVRVQVNAPGGWPDQSNTGSARPHYVVFFIDMENDDPLRRAEALDAVVAFAREGLEGAARAAVVSYDGTLHLDLPFTGDRDALESALRLAWSRHGRPAVDLRSRIRKLVARFEDCTVSGGEFSRVLGSDSCLRQVVHEYAEELRPRTMDYLAALKQMLEFAGGLRGRKTVVAISHGVAVDPMPELLEAMRAVFGNTDQVAQMQLDIGFGNQPRLELDRLLRLAIANKITLNFVDRARSPTGDVSAGQAHALQPGARPMLAAFTATQEDMKEIAASTGGIFAASTDLAVGLRKVIAAQEGGYELGYYMDESPPTDRLAKVSVSSTRKGVRIHHRRGYYAQKASATASLKGRIVLGPPMPLHDNGRQGTHYSFRIELDPTAIGYVVAGDEASANFTLHFIVQNEQGQHVAESFHFINHAYPRAVWESGQSEPVVIPGWVEASPGAYALLAVVRNTVTGREGQITTAMEVGSGRLESTPAGAPVSGP